MTEIISGALGTGAHGEIAGEIAKLVGENKKCILIVPEQETLDVEKEMSKSLPDSSPLYFEVTNFTRLANSAKRAFGALTELHSDRSRRALVMWDTIAELAPMLKVLNPKGAISADIVNQAISAIKEMQTQGHTALDFRATSEKLSAEDKRLSDKLADLSLISTLYEKTLYEKFSDVGDELYTFLKQLDENPNYLVGTAVFIEGFTSFTEAQYQVIGKLMKRTDLTLALDLAKEDSSAFEYTETGLTRKHIVTIGAKLGVPVKEKKLAGNKTSKRPLLAEISAALWKSNYKIDKSSLQFSDDLKIYEARDPYEECEQIAASIRKKIDTGARYSDIALIARNTDLYAGILDNALTKCTIPHFISKPIASSEFDAVKLIYAAIDAISSHYSRDAVLSYMKSGLLDIPRDACDEFELYTETWQLEGRRFTDGEIWNMDPAGYTTRPSPDKEEKLLKINSVKEKLILPLSLLDGELKDSKTVKEYAFALVKFLINIGIEDGICKKCLELYEIGETEKAEEESRIFKIISDALDVLVSSVGDSACDIDSFKSRLSLVLSEAKVSRIPSYADQVLIGNADVLRMGKKKHVYLFGVNQGEFPMIPKDTSFFNDGDKIKLSKFGIALEENTEFCYSKELLYFTRAFASATDSVTIFYTLSDLSYKETRKSDVITNIEKMTDKAIMPIKISSLSIKERLYSPENSIFELRDTGSEKLRNALFELGFSEAISGADIPIANDSLSLSEESVKAMYPGDIYLSQTRIDSFVNCPLSYFLKYSLRLSENEAVSFDARNIGSFIHSVFENFFAELKKKNVRPSELSESDKWNVTERAAKNYVNSLDDSGNSPARTNAVINRLAESAYHVIENLCAELEDSKFTPEFFELPIKDGIEGFPEAASFTAKDGRRIKVIGNIDRVDLYRNDGAIFVKVVDYKTGQKQFSPSDLDEGKNLQMFLYLKSIVESRDKKFLAKLGADENTKLIPAGVIYVKSDVGDVKISSPYYADAIDAVMKKQKREGMVLDTEENLSAMGSYIPIKFTASGAPTKASENLLYSEEGWGKLMDKLNCAVVRVSEGMTSGAISALPMKTKRSSPCEYCKFKPICRNASI